MKIIIRCEPEVLPHAYTIINEEVADNWTKKYNRPGWGWHFYRGNSKFFVRGIIGGISIKQVK